MRPVTAWSLIAAAVLVAVAASAHGEHIRWGFGLVLILASAVVGRVIGQRRERRRAADGHPRR